MKKYSLVSCLCTDPIPSNGTHVFKVKYTEGRDKSAEIGISTKNILYNDYLSYEDYAYCYTGEGHTVLHGKSVGG